MKTIGLIGGMSWESTDTYYQLINRKVRDKLGTLNSADILMRSLNFAEIEGLQRAGRWVEVADLIGWHAWKLEEAGADCICICSVTGHEGTGIIKKYLRIPLIHIADCVNDVTEGHKKLGLLGTVYTMEKDYFKSQINAEVVIPNKEDRKFISDVIYCELTLGILKHESRQRFKEIIKKLILAGADGIVLGCTEIPLLVHPSDSCVPMYDATYVHSMAAVDYALGDK